LPGRQVRRDDTQTDDLDFCRGRKSRPTQNGSLVARGLLGHTSRFGSCLVAEQQCLADDHRERRVLPRRLRDPRHESAEVAQ